MPILTVIIPTKNRADTLVHAIRTVTAQPNENIEIIASDNFSAPEVKQAVDSINDKRLRYIRTSEPLGMSEHWNFAIEHATGDWVTIIGDDDGLVPGAVDKLMELSRKHPDIKAITSANCVFKWPLNSNDTCDARLTVTYGKGYKIREGKNCLKRTMYGEIIGLPTIYTGGFVRRDLIEEIRKKSPDNKFFQSINPDLYSGMAMSSVADKYIYSAEPLGIAGTSKHSNGHKHKDKSHAEMSKLGLFNEGKLRFLPELGNGAVETMHLLLYEAFLRCQHLRNNDNMGVTLPQQLELSILNSSKRIRENVISYCRDIADKNNIEFAPILKAVDRKKPMQQFRKQWRKLLRHIPGLDDRNRKTFKDLGLKNVYDASRELGKLLA